MGCRIASGHCRRNAIRGCYHSGFTRTQPEEETMLQTTKENTHPRRGALRLAAAALFAATLAAPLMASAQKCEDPKVLRFSIIPTQESVRELTLFQPLLDLLSKNTGKKIEFYLPTSYSSVVE